MRRAGEACVSVAPKHTSRAAADTQRRHRSTQRARVHTHCGAAAAPAGQNSTPPLCSCRHAPLQRVCVRRRWRAEQCRGLHRVRSSRDSPARLSGRRREGGGCCDWPEARARPRTARPPPDVTHAASTGSMMALGGARCWPGVQSGARLTSWRGCGRHRVAAHSTRQPVAFVASEGHRALSCCLALPDVAQLLESSFMQARRKRERSPAAAQSLLRICFAWRTPASFDSTANARSSN